MSTKSLNILLVFCFFVWGTAVAAEEAADGDTTSATEVEGEGLSNTGQQNQVDKLAAKYGEAFGGEDNARSVAEGLRNGDESFDVSLETTDGGTTTPETVTIDNPMDRGLGWGEVDHAMGLAESQLGDGYTGADFKAATEEVLQMRADGMGWGEIAREYDTKLGWIKSGKMPPDQTVETSSTDAGEVASATTSHGNGKALGKGIVGGDGSLSSTATSHGNGKASGKGIVGGDGSVASSAGVHGGSKALGRGIVSGLGASAGGGVVSSGQGKAYGHGITSGMGQPALHSNSGQGNAFGHSK